MDKSDASAKADVFFLALRGLAAIANLAMVAGVIYAAAMAIRYWPSIGV